MSNAQLIELKNDSRKHQESSPGTVTIEEVQNPGKDHEHGPEAPEVADGNDSQVIEQEREANQDEDPARNDAATATPAQVYPDHHGTPAGALLFEHNFVPPIRAVMNVSMNLIVNGVAKIVAEFLRVEIVFVAHTALL